MTDYFKLNAHEYVKCYVEALMTVKLKYVKFYIFSTAVLKYSSVHVLLVGVGVGHGVIIV